MSDDRIIDTDGSDEGLIESRPCRKCKGKGYHHGFGENGCDPDWCTRCGGPGSEWHQLLTAPDT